LSSAAQWLIRACLVVAIVISAFLAWNSLRGGAVPGCGPESGCDKVLSSRWAYVFGLPLSIFALPVYIVLLALLFQKTLRWKAILPLALIIFWAAFWFVGLQAFALRAFCKFCMTAHVAGVLAALILLKNNPLPTMLTLRSAGISAVAVAVIVAGQFASPPPAPSIIRGAHSQALVAAPAPATPPSGTNAAAIDPTISIVQGQFTLNLTKVPLVGPITASKKLVKLFDYSCHHCRDLHQYIEQFRAKYPGQLAIVMLPVPLNSDCNPIVKKTPKDHINACDYARLGLAVFFANPAKFAEFTDWVFTPPRPPAVSDTRKFAEDLVGARALQDALNSPAINEQLSTDINIYIASSRFAHSGQIPQMLFGDGGGSIGAVNSLSQLEQILTENLGPFTPPPSSSQAK
jgi:uncharacterized membrane protein